MNKIGIFAGAFDPIHDGHLEVARAALESLELDKVLFMTEEELWTEKQPVSVGHRRKMVDLAIKYDEHITQLELEDKKFDISNTLKTLEYQFPGSELYFIFGADVFMRMNTKQWPGLDKLLKHYVAVFERGGVDESAITSHAKSLGIVVAILPSMHPHHSSTDVRMKPHDKTIWLPKVVADYIDEYRLY